MNIPNAITLSRIPMLFVIVGLLYTTKAHTATIAWILFAFSAFTDWLDGFLARKLKTTSPLGAFIDAVVDKIFMIGIFITMLYNRIIPHWTIVLITLIVLREFLITAFRSVAATKNIVIAAELGGKLKTIVQMVSTFILLGWYAFRQDHPGIFSDEEMNKIQMFGLALFTFSTVMTIYSGASYLIRYKSVLSDL